MTGSVLAGSHTVPIDPVYEILHKGLSVGDPTEEQGQEEAPRLDKKHVFAELSCMTR